MIGKMGIIALITVLVMGSATALTDEEQTYLTEKAQLKNTVEVWIHAEENSDLRIARDDLRQLGQSYSNAGISIDPVGGFYTQRGMKELRTKMTYEASRAHILAPTLRTS